MPGLFQQTTFCLYTDHLFFIRYIVQKQYNTVPNERRHEQRCTVEMKVSSSVHLLCSCTSSTLAAFCPAESIYYYEHELELLNQ